MRGQFSLGIIRLKGTIFVKGYISSVCRLISKQRAKEENWIVWKFIKILPVTTKLFILNWNILSYNVLNKILMNRIIIISNCVFFERRILQNIISLICMKLNIPSKTTMWIKWNETKHRARRIKMHLWKHL